MSTGNRKLYSVRRRFLNGVEVTVVLCALILGVYFGAAIIGQILRVPAVTEADWTNIGQIVSSKKTGIQVTVKGPVHDTDSKYFWIWDAAPGHVGIQVYYSLSSFLQPGSQVEVSGTTVNDFNGFGIQANTVKGIESKPYWQLPTFGDFQTNLKYVAVILIVVPLTVGSILGYLQYRIIHDVNASKK